MEFIPQSITDVLVIEPQVFGDERGYFSEIFRKDKFEDALGYRVDFIQDNQSKSSKGVLRGLHFQLPPFAQSKLVRVIEGAVLDVAVDIRKGSPTFAQHVAVELSGLNKKQMFIPRGFAHGFLVLSETAIFAYKVDNFYSPDDERGLAFDDIHLGIDWRLAPQDMKLSERDARQPRLDQLECLFEFKHNYYG